MNNEKVAHIYTMEYYSVRIKEEDPAICNNVDGPWGHHAKWNKSVKEREIPYNFILYNGIIWNLKKQTKLRHTQNRTSNMVTIVSNSVLYIWKLLRVDLKSSYYKKKIITMCGASC